MDCEGWAGPSVSSVGARQEEPLGGWDNKPRTVCQGSGIDKENAEYYLWTKNN